MENHAKTGDYVSTGRAAALLGVSRATVSRKFDQGLLLGKVNPITKERLIRRSSLLAFMEHYHLPVPRIAAARTSVLLATMDDSLRATVKAVSAMDERFELSETHRGADALLASLTDQPGVLVTGEELPDMRVADVFGSLRRCGKPMRLKILCCLGQTSPSEALQWGADMALTEKEWTVPSILLGRLRDLAELPLGKAEMEWSDNRRRSSRFPVSLPAKVGIYRLKAPRVRSWGTATMRNISAEGAYLVPLKLPEGAIPSDPFRLVLYVDHPPLTQWQAHCRLVRLQSNGGLTAGVQFARISGADRRKIHGLAKAASGNGETGASSRDNEPRATER